MHKDPTAELYAEFGRIVRHRRAELGMSQAEVAERIELTRASISNLEAGRQRPQLHQVYVLARILETTVNDLLPPDSVDMDESRHNHLKTMLMAAASQQP